MRHLVVIRLVELRELEEFASQQRGQLPALGLLVGEPNRNHPFTISHIPLDSMMLNAMVSTKSITPRQNQHIASGSAPLDALTRLSAMSEGELLEEDGKVRAIHGSRF